MTPWQQRAAQIARQLKAVSIENMGADDDARERRLRRAAARLGLRLAKSGQRDPAHYLFGTYMLVDQRSGYRMIWGGGAHGYGLTLDEIEDALNNCGDP
jgi:hypothetical protein